MSVPNQALRTLAMLAALAFANAAFAGPPLICHPIATSADAALLPWANRNHWHSPDVSYDRSTVVGDTLQLLSPDAPILARMENMRRAAIYADRDPALAAALLGAVVERTKSKPDDTRAAALEWFDAGYLVETYRQLDLVHRYDMLPAHRSSPSLVPPALDDVDGYAFVQKAASLAPELRAEIDFASALMSQEPLMTKHFESAASRAADGSLLAQNLAKHDVR